MQQLDFKLLSCLKRGGASSCAYGGCACKCRLSDGPTPPSPQERETPERSHRHVWDMMREGLAQTMVVAWDWSWGGGTV
eukprot:scaffold88019_cov18-Tisochrysis_lutea.AAC.1